MNPQREITLIYYDDDDDDRYTVVIERKSADKHREV